MLTSLTKSYLYLITDGILVVTNHHVFEFS